MLESSLRISSFTAKSNILERLAGKPPGPLIESIRNAMAEVLQDERLREWFDGYFAYGKSHLGCAFCAFSRGKGAEEGFTCKVEMFEFGGGESQVAEVC